VIGEPNAASKATSRCASHRSPKICAATGTGTPSIWETTIGVSAEINFVAIIATKWSPNFLFHLGELL